VDMDKILIRYVNAAYVKVICEKGIAQELKEYFTFEIPNARFNPKVKARIWDGKIRLFNSATRQIYRGLVGELEEFARIYKYELIVENEEYDDSFSVAEAQTFIEELNPKYEPRDYQIDAFVKAIRHRRRLLLSPTSSGKSLIIYMIMRYLSKKTLIVVPTTQLVEQMYSDFADYSEKNGWSVEKNCHRIYQGKDKNTEKSIVISTWQSIYKLDPEWFEQFDVIIGDECHQFQAKSLKAIMENSINAYYRIGTTGTLDGSATNERVITGLFGPIEKVTTMKDLMESKTISDFRIKALILKHPKEVCKKLKYVDEIKHLVTYQPRTKFIVNLTKSLTGNTLVLFNFIAHGKIIFDLLKSKIHEDRKIFFIYGKTDVEEREEARKIMETETNAIIVASVKIFSTGVNIKQLHNIIFASPSKSRIRVLQSIGRALRKAENKTMATLFDIADDMRYNKGKPNTTLAHFVERVEIYASEGFAYKTYKIELKDKGNDNTLYR
jgi:superfamily II DNA or RNA helicase